MNIKTSKEKENQAIKLYKEGILFREIIKIVGISSSVLKRILKNIPKRGRHNNKAWNKGKKGEYKLWPNGRVFTKEHSENISKSHKGKIVTKETREKLRIINTGKKLTEEHKKKISEANKGKINENRSMRLKQGMFKGHHHTLESRLKIGKNNKGEKCHFWKGGITLLTDKIRTCFKYRQWRSDIYTRDNFICQICDQRGGEKNADHYPESFSSIINRLKIKSFEQALECEELWNLNNGRTLCVPCHKKTDTYSKNLRKE